MKKIIRYQYKCEHEGCSRKSFDKKEIELCEERHTCKHENLSFSLPSYYGYPMDLNHSLAKCVDCGYIVYKFNDDDTMKDWDKNQEYISFMAEIVVKGFIEIKRRIELHNTSNIIG